MAYRWAGTHAYRDHANDRVIEPGEEIPADVVEQVAAAHPHQVEEVDEEPEADGDEPEGESEKRDMAGNVAGEDICGYEKDDDTLCQRDAGWGRDADSGRCSDHVDE